MTMASGEASERRPSKAEQDEEATQQLKEAREVRKEYAKRQVVTVNLPEDEPVQATAVDYRRVEDIERDEDVSEHPGESPILGPLIDCPSCGMGYAPLAGRPFSTCPNCKLTFSVWVSDPSLRPRPDEEPQLPDPLDHDPVNHPSYYTGGPACPGCGRTIECIDITRWLPFNPGNAVRYVWRRFFGRKPGEPNTQGLEKAVWYLNDEIARLKEVDGA